MRSIACLLSLLLALLVTATPVLAADAPLAHVSVIEQAALEQGGGAAAALAPRLTFPAPPVVSFGFQGPKPAALPHVVVPPQHGVVPTPRFEGFGGYAVTPALQVHDVVEVQDVVEVKDVVEVAPVVEAAPRVVRRYYTTRPAYVAHSSSYYVPTYRVYDSCCSWRSCYRPCWRSCWGWGCGWGCYRPCWRPSVYVGWGWGWGCGW